MVAAGRLLSAGRGPSGIVGRRRAVREVAHGAPEGGWCVRDGVGTGGRIER